MFQFIVKRIVLTVPMVIGISLVTYAVIFLAPGGPAAGVMSDLNPKVSQEYKDKIIKQYRFDQPFYVQYGAWLTSLLRLDFGLTQKDNQPVIDKILERLPRTLLLTVTSLILCFILAIPIGMMSAIKQNSWIDRSLTVLVFIGVSVPMYWIALLLMIFFGIYLGWFPITGFRSIFVDDFSWFQRVIDVLWHLALPLLVTTMAGLAGLSRYVRYGILEVIRQDYIRTARAKGLSEHRVMWVHALRNTLIPLVTILGFSLPELISAGVIFETIFSYPGLGRLIYEAIMARDVFLIMGSVTFGAFLTLIGNLIADISYAFVDPRIRYR